VEGIASDSNELWWELRVNYAQCLLLVSLLRMTQWRDGESIKPSTKIEWTCPKNMIQKFDQHNVKEECRTGAEQ
jgi:hypothetical protein